MRQDACWHVNKESMWGRRSDLIAMQIHGFTDLRRHAMRSMTCEDTDRTESADRVVSLTGLRVLIGWSH